MIIFIAFEEFRELCSLQKMPGHAGRVVGAGVVCGLFTFASGRRTSEDDAVTGLRLLDVLFRNVFFDLEAPLPFVKGTTLPPAFIPALLLLLRVHPFTLSANHFPIALRLKSIASESILGESAQSSAIFMRISPRAREVSGRTSVSRAAVQRYKFEGFLDSDTRPCQHSPSFPLCE